MSVDAPSLLRLEKTSLREQALTALRRAITTGQLPPGTHLVETELSEALQISRGTLREAMRQLQQEGLISAGARGRLSVRHLDAKEIKDIFNVRAALESLAARELAARPDRADAVAACARRWTTWSDWAASNLEDRIEADLKFHRTMCQLSGNETLLHPGRRWRAASGCRSCSPASTGRSRTWTPNGIRTSSTRSSPATPIRPPPPCVTTWPAPQPFSWTERPDPGASFGKKSPPPRSRKSVRGPARRMDRSHRSPLYGLPMPRWIPTPPSRRWGTKIGQRAEHRVPLRSGCCPQA